MNLLQEKRRALGVHRLYKGGSSSSNSSSNDTANTTNSSSTNVTQTTNTDRRLVLQDSMAIGDGASYWSNDQSTAYNTTYAADADVLKTFAGAMPDAVKALGNAGSDIIKSAGGAVVDLNRDSIAANSKSWDSTLKYGSDFVDRSIDMLSESFGIAQTSIDKAYGTANAAVAAFTPTENKNADIGKYAMLAAAAVCAMVLLKDSK